MFKLGVALNLIGKSNLIDAVAFALALPLPRGKHSHVRDLVYASAPSSSIDGQDDVARGMLQNDIEQQDPEPAAGNGIASMYV